MAAVLAGEVGADPCLPAELDEISEVNIDASAAIPELNTAHLVSFGFISRASVPGVTLMALVGTPLLRLWRPATGGKRRRAQRDEPGEPDLAGRAG